MTLQFPEFKYISEDALREWRNSNSSFKLPDPVPMPRFLYELCWTLVRGELPLQKCRTALDSVEFSGEHPKEEMASVFADVVAFMGQDHTLPGEYRGRLVKMAKWLVECALVSSRLLQERCEEDFLWESEMIKIKAQDLKAKEVRVNTRLLYQQTKFNLLREESEGYAKLVTLLCQSGLGALTENASMATISIIKSLIGHFDLDPNRVFDIVLECFELHPDSNIFYDLIPIFPKSHASQILGFKFQYYQCLEVNTHVPLGLFRLTALLVKAELIDLDSIYTHLLPKDNEAFDHYDTFLAKQFDEVSKIGKINLAATGKDLMDEDKQDVSTDLYFALDMESDAVAERAPELDNNQNLGLLNGFLSVDDWRHAHILFDRLSHLNPVEHIQICDSLFRVIEKTISPAYSVVCRTHSQGYGTSLSLGSDALEPPAVSSLLSSFVDIPGRFFEMLASAGPYLYRDSLLLQKVCRVLRAYYLSARELVNTPASITTSEYVDLGSRDPRFRLKEARLKIEEALGICLLPSMQLIPANPAVGQEIWEVLSLLPYEVRYRLYGEWEKEDERIPMVLAARQSAKLDTRRILKRLAKENLKQLGRSVAKLAHANPMTVLRTIVHQIEAYKDMITPVVDAFKYLTQLEYDILEYVVIERLAQGGREKLKEDGLNLSDWLQSLASFWGHLCKKYPSMELRGLFQYLVNQLKKGIGIELVLLQELIQQMANVQYTENMTEEQLDAMAGSETLRYQATLFGITRNNKALSKSTNRLRDSLLPKDEPKLAIPLLILIAQHRSMVVINADAPHIKVVSEQFDRCHGTLLQYVEFLSSALTPTTAYAQLIPNLDDLVHKYHLEPEVAFLIYRPVMRLFRCLNGTEVFWPLDDAEEANIRNADRECDLFSTSTDIVLDLGSSRKPVTWTDLLDVIHSMLPPKAWNGLSPDLYTTFWGLTLYDLYVPRNRYESEIAKQHAALKALEELSDNSSSAITKRKKDKERIQELLDRLTAELQRHEQHVSSVHRRLGREKDKWLSSCPDALKINMEFLQRCIFPRCIFSMPDAVYCAMFVHTLHSLGTPFFNTVNHIDVLICKTLQPMICCCTEFEAGRLGRFLFETLKLAYHWKSDESIYERECGNMPGFAVYYRYPNSQRVTFSQFIRVHIKWSTRITRLLIQCLESTEYLEIRNALIMLTKISSVFPVTRKSGLNLEKRVAKIKGDEREDLKVLATGVAASLAARKSYWVSEEEFGMGHIDLKRAASPAKPLAANSLNLQNGSAPNIFQNEAAGARNGSTVPQHIDHLNAPKDQISRSKPIDGRADRSESNTGPKLDLAQQKLKGGFVNNSLDIMPGIQKNMDEPTKIQSEETINKVTSKAFVESETRSQTKRSVQTAVAKQPKPEFVRDDSKSGKSVSRITSQPPATVDRDLSAHPSDSRQGGMSTSLASTNGSLIPASGKVSAASARMTIDMRGTSPKLESELRVSSGKDFDYVDISEMARPVSSRPTHPPLPDDSIAVKSTDKQQKRTALTEEQDRLNKRRKGDFEAKDGEGMEARVPDRERNIDPRLVDKSSSLDIEKTANEEQTLNRPGDKLVDKSKDKTSEKYERDHREKLERPDKSRNEDILDKSRDRSMERHARERSVERMVERGMERNFERSGDKVKDDRNKPRHGEPLLEKTHLDDRFHGQNLPPPPPLPASFVPQSVSGGRRDEDVERRVGSTRHIQRLSPRHDEKERRRSEESLLPSQDEVKRRREDDLRERKRDERDGLLIKVEERERDKGNILKDEMDATAASKRRKLKRDHPDETSGDYSPIIPPLHPPLTLGISQPHDGRERGDRKGVMVQHRAAYMEDSVPRLHGKEAASKNTRRESDQIYDREWEEEKRQRAEPKRKHRK